MLQQITDGAASANYLQSQINLATKWCQANKMHFNPTKCEILHLGPKNPNFAYYLGGNFIKSVPEVVDLGIAISAQRLLRPVVENAIQRSTHAAVNARLHLKTADFTTRCKVWKTYIMPLIEYGIELWAPNQLRQLAELNKPYREFFAQIKPPQNAFIPFTPSQRTILIELLSIFDFVQNEEKLKSDLFFDVTQAPQKTRSVTTQQLKPQKSVSAKLPQLLQKRLDLFNAIPLTTREGSRTNFKIYVKSILLPTLPGQKLREKVKNGKLYSKATYCRMLFSKPEPGSESSR